MTVLPATGANAAAIRRTTRATPLFPDVRLFLRDKIYTNKLMTEPLGVNVDDLTMMNDIRIRLAQVTEADIAAIERHIQPRESSDKDIGTIVRRDTQALYVLKMRLISEGLLEEALAKMATDEVKEQEHIEKASLLDMLEDVVSEMWWTQAKLDIGFLKKESVGIRRGWILVKNDKNPGSIMQAIISGVMNPWCGICGSRDFSYEDAATKYATMAEASTPLRESEIDQQLSRVAMASAIKKASAN